MSLLILPGDQAECKSDHEPVEWFPPRMPGQPAAEVRATRPPLPVAGRKPFREHPLHVQHWLLEHGFTETSYDAGINSAIVPLRVDPAEFRPGDRVGSWVLLAHGAVYWTCRCDCGTERTILGHSLAAGTTLSCGHCRCESAESHTAKHESAA